MTPHETPHDTTTVRLVGGAQGFNWLPVFVAEEQGIFERHGLKVELEKLGSVDKATSAVRDGSADLAITPPEGAVADCVAGGDLRIIGSNSERLPMSLVARPGFTELEQLRGARIGTSSLTEGTAVYVRRMLAQVGLHRPDDYEFVLAGVHTTRWAALLADEIDAAPQPAPWDLLAQREGYALLGSMSEVFPEIVFAALIGANDWLDSNGEVARRMVQAMAEGHAIVNDPAHDLTTIPIYQRITTPDEPELAAAGFRQSRDLGMWPAGLRVSEAAFETTLDAMVESQLLDEERRADARSVLDPRFT